MILEVYFNLRATIIQLHRHYFSSSPVDSYSRCLTSSTCWSLNYFLLNFPECFQDLFDPTSWKSLHSAFPYFALIQFVSKGFSGQKLRRPKAAISCSIEREHVFSKSSRRYSTRELYICLKCHQSPLYSWQLFQDLKSCQFAGSHHLASSWSSCSDWRGRSCSAFVCAYTTVWAEWDPLLCYHPILPFWISLSQYLHFTSCNVFSIESRSCLSEDPVGQQYRCFRKL